MSYADTLPELSAQYRAELADIEKARRMQRAQFQMCEEARKAMLDAFFKREREKP